LDFVADEINHAYLALSKSSLISTSQCRTISTTSYASASIGVSENNPVQPLLRKTPTHILIISQQLPLSPSNSFLLFQLFCC
jgi:hypothetical protein